MSITNQSEDVVVRPKPSRLFSLSEDHNYAENLPDDTEDFLIFHYSMGKLYYDKADLNKAEISFTKALDLTQKGRDNFTILKILSFITRIAFEKQQDKAVQTYIEKSKILLDEMKADHKFHTAELYYNMGLVNTYVSDFTTARNHFGRACQMAQEEKDSATAAKSLLGLGINAYNHNDFTSALQYLNQLETLLTDMDKSYLNGVMYYYRGKIDLSQKKFQSAIEFFEKSQRKFNEKNCWNIHGYILLNKGMAWRDLEDYNKALLLYQEALSSTDRKVFRQLSALIDEEIACVNDSSVDIYLDWDNRKIKEKTLGIIDFRHRFILLEIFNLLVRNVGELFSKEQLAKIIWENEYDPRIHDKLIYTSMSRLRKIIEPESKTKYKYIIRTKEGYTFNPKAKVRFQRESSVNSRINKVELSSPV